MTCFLFPNLLNGIVAILLVAFSLRANAINFNAPTQVVGDSYTLSWSSAAVNGASSYVLEEKNNVTGTFFTLKAVIMGPDNGSFAVTGKALGLYTYRLSDCATGSCSSTPVLRTVQVISPNNPPTISTISNVSINEGITSTGDIQFTVNDVDSPLTVSAVSSNKSLIPDANLTIAGVGNFRTINAQTLATIVGSSTITVTVSDGVAPPVTTSFVVTVADLPAQLFLNPTSTNGIYTIEWRYASLFTKISESSVTSAYGGLPPSTDLSSNLSANGSKVLTRTVSGTYRYDLSDCSFGPDGKESCKVTDTKTIVVNLSGSSSSAAPSVANSVASSSKSSSSTSSIANSSAAASSSGTTFKYSYDELGRVITVADPINQARYFSYDKAGNRTKLLIGNRAPVAVNDSITLTALSTPTPLNVTFNDTDADGDKLSVINFTQPSNAQVNGNGITGFTIVGTAAHLTSTFTYTISDGKGGQATSTATVITP